MRAIWKGHLQFSLVTIPIRIYNAIETAASISFNLLSKDGHHPVSYEKKDKVTGKPLKADEILKGFQYEPGQYVIIDDSDFEKVKLKSEKIIAIEGFVQANEIHPTLFEAPYFIGPDGDVAAKTYGLLTETLRQTNKIAVGKVVLRDRETPVLITPHERGMLLYRLRFPNEVRSINEVPNLLEVKADKEQIALAKTLVDSMTTTFTTIEMVDHYTEELRKMIDAKVAGKEVVSVTIDEPKVVDIMTALKASIDAAKKPMEKAMGNSTQKVKEEKAQKESRRKAG
jgi:DNA end-binding protein Ku